MSTLQIPQSWLHEPPDWWNQNGFKMGIHTWSPGKKELIIENLYDGTTRLEVRSQQDPGNYYQLVWYINHQDKDPSRGECILSRDELEEAFALGEAENNDDPRDGDFEREYCYLNIPYRGTGEYGDSNLSIFLSLPIRQAVSDLLELD